MKTVYSFARSIVMLACVVGLGLAGAACQSAPDSAEPMMLTDYDPEVDAIIDEMTLAEKIGQMTQAEITGLEDPEDVTTYFLGSILSGGSADPAEGNSVEAWSDVYDDMQQRALQTRLGIPLLYGIDAVHGHSNVLGAVIFPHNIGLGATRNPELVEEIGRITAREMRATGTNWNFAPAVSVVRDERWGRAYEGFSEEPDLAGTLGAAAVRGYQGDDLSDSVAVLATAKHYVGDGGTVYGTGDFNESLLDQGDMQLDEETMRQLHLAPYEDVLEAGVASIMPSYSSWNGEKLSGSEYLLTDVLKEEMGFEGFLISDYNAVDQVDPDYKMAIEKSINAGMDMVMVPNRYREFIRNLTELVEEGRVSEERIDDAVRRILRVKFAMGLMGDDAELMANRSLHASFGSEEHRQVGREAVRQSLVLLKNEGAALPLAKDVTRLHVAGKNADDIGNQSGGWTIHWQGESGDVTTGGTTILEAIQNTVADGAEVTYSLDGSGAGGADAGVVVIGETPYAEGVGDTDDLSLDADDVAAVENVAQAGIPVVVVLVSGRPMIINDVLDQSDAFVAAWLPGTEGQGVADVLFGDYPPTGQLSFTWPRSMDQIPINVGDEEYDPLFEYGFGLTYD